VGSSLGWNLFFLFFRNVGFRRVLLLAAIHRREEEFPDLPCWKGKIGQPSAVVFIGRLSKFSGRFKKVQTG